MGTPTPDNESAVGCARCFGDGSIIGGVQPRYINVLISGCRPAFLIDDANGVTANGSYRLQHKQSCLYEFNDGDQLVRLDWSAVASRVFHIILGISPTSFFTDPGILCATSIEGNEFGFLSKAWIGGRAKISWSEDGL